MKHIYARNVNEALVIGLNALKVEGVKRDSRNGPVQVFPTPVVTQYTQPRERVLFYPERDANPFFHFMEALWMLRGRADVEWISQFSSNIANYSDDGITFHGAYGHRWRFHFDLDQVEKIIELLKANPDDRRTVLQMWDPNADLGKEGKDFPCNLTATFRINPYGSLDMTVFNRSNDMIWGAYGANAVHFSMLQEYMACMIGVPVGQYWQISTNFHAYQDTLDKHGHVTQNVASAGAYEHDVYPFPMVNTRPEVWHSELDMFMTEGPVMGYTDPFFKKVAVPMLQAWQAWKDPDKNDKGLRAYTLAESIAATDWKKACIEWLKRRMK